MKSDLDLLIIDDELAKFLLNAPEWAEELNSLGNLLLTESINSASRAMDLVTEHLEDDCIILLDDTIEENFDSIRIMMSFKESMSPEEFEKLSKRVYSFSGDAMGLRHFLVPLGVKHFPGKEAKSVRACLQGNCYCPAEVQHVMSERMMSLERIKECCFL